MYHTILVNGYTMMSGINKYCQHYKINIPQSINQCPLHPCSIKTREVLGNLEGKGDGFPIKSSNSVVEYGPSLIINPSLGMD